MPWHHSYRTPRPEWHPRAPRPCGRILLAPPHAPELPCRPAMRLCGQSAPQSCGAPARD